MSERKRGVLSFITKGDNSLSPHPVLSAFHKHTNPMPEDTHAELKQLLLDKSVRTGEFTLASGKKSDLYVDCRVTSFDSRGARLIGEEGWALVRKQLSESGLSAAAIGGMTLGADPISLAIGMESARQQPAVGEWAS